MGGTGVIDRFLEVFTSYIDSGFGLLGGEVAFLATTLIVIDVTLAALFWAWGADDDTIGDAGREIVRRQIDIPPTLTIRPGFPVRVIVTRDLILEPQGGH